MNCSNSRRSSISSGANPLERLSSAEARRIALAAQGFADRRPRGTVALRHLERVLKRLHLVQLDSVNVLVRSHYMPFFSRLGTYDCSLLDDQAYRKGRVFEYWAHEACIVPVEQYPLFRHRMEGWRRWPSRKPWLESQYPGYLDAVLEEVRTRGPLTVGQLEDGGARTGPWWGYGKGKLALEAHFAHGDLTTRARRNFSRVYDLPDRVLPAAALSAPPPSAEDAHSEMLRRAAAALGVATVADLADYYRLKTAEARPRIQELADSGELLPVEVEGWAQPAYLHRDAKARRVNAVALLTPFDSLVWNRDRTERLFGFRYRIEIYVPEGQRQFGYYVMPFLLGDRLVARVDLKAHRQAGTLEARGAFLETGEKAGPVAEALAGHLAEMAAWLGLERVTVALKGDLAPALAAAVGDATS